MTVALWWHIIGWGFTPGKHVQPGVCSSENNTIVLFLWQWHSGGVSLAEGLLQENMYSLECAGVPLPQILEVSNYYSPPPFICVSCIWSKKLLVYSSSRQQHYPRCRWRWGKQKRSLFEGSVCTYKFLYELTKMHYSDTTLSNFHI